ncbi:DUF5995 family protein [Mycolicibacterium wolinskyi]|uniref:DUF5995 family protein n=1 Tax=Mycolicibacterium wolinskyi TaxID=59750 RepID=UPI00391788AB
MAQRPPLTPLPSATTLDEVVDTIDSVIQWSIESSSRLGYFAALYKRITIAVRTAVAEGVFEDGPRLQRLDVAFANRYFDALNGHFHPGSYAKPTRSWQATFDAATRAEPIILQHMLAGINAHIGLDLGIATQELVPAARLWQLKTDFDRINAVLASQVTGIVVDINELSPALADIYAVLMDNQILLINEAVRGFRDDAWRFATVLSVQPRFTRPVTIRLRDVRVARQGELIYDPPGVVGLIQWAVTAVAARESRDIVKNIRVLDEIANSPAPIATAL